MARKPDEADAGFAVGVYSEDIIESNAEESFGREATADEKQHALSSGFVDSEGGITKKGWEQLNEDIVKVERNSVAWMRRKFIDARDEGHGDTDLLGTFWFDPRDPDQAWLVDLAADTGRQERVDMTDTSYGDLGDTAFNGISDFGHAVLGGGITFFDVKPEDMEVVEQTLEHERRRGKQSRSREAPFPKRGPSRVGKGETVVRGPYEAMRLPGGKWRLSRYGNVIGVYPSEDRAMAAATEYERTHALEGRRQPSYARPTRRRPPPTRRR